MAKKTVKRNNHHLSFNIWLKTRELHALDDAYDNLVRNFLTQLIADDGDDTREQSMRSEIDTLRDNYLRERAHIKAEIKAEQAKQEVIEAGGDMLASATAITIDT